MTCPYRILYRIGLIFRIEWLRRSCSEAPVKAAISATFAKPMSSEKWNSLLRFSGPSHLSEESLDEELVAKAAAFLLCLDAGLHHFSVGLVDVPSLEFVQRDPAQA